MKKVLPNENQENSLDKELLDATLHHEEASGVTGPQTSVSSNYNASQRGTPKRLTGFSVTKSPGRLD